MLPQSLQRASLNIKMTNYLSDEEKILRTKILDSYFIIQKLKNEFELVKDSFVPFDLEVYEHFQEIRRQIDLNREREEFNSNRDKIDDISLEMIDRTKTFEILYGQSLNQKLENLLKYEIKFINLEETINELFLNPNLKIKTIKLILLQNENLMSEIKSKRDEMQRIRASLKKNQFLPIESSINIDIVGHLLLNDDTNLCSSFILDNNKQLIDLVNLCGFSLGDRWSLLYRASRDGFGARDFHSKCDGHSNTLTLVKCSITLNLFGGFTTNYWESVRGFKSDSEAFIFSLINNENCPCKLNVKSTSIHSAIYCDSNRGPSFGFGDIILSDKANTNLKSYSLLGSAYSHPKYCYGSAKARSFLSGLNGNFGIEEIEVFQKEK